MIVLLLPLLLYVRASLLIVSLVIHRSVVVNRFTVYNSHHCATQPLALLVL
jgi:hypothetical protein